MGLETRNRLVPYANPRFFHDPEMAGKVGIGRCLEKPSTDCQNVIPGLALEPHEAGLLTGQGKDPLLGQVGSVAHRSLHGFSGD